jgi:transcriptional regulator with XRE-family HTH domain
MRRVEDFGERLKRLREHSKLKQGDLARSKDPIERRNFGRYVSKLETGEEENPSLLILERLAQGFRMTLSDFFGHLEKNTYAMTSPDRQKGDKDRSASISQVVHTQHAAAIPDRENNVADRLDTLERAIAVLRAERRGEMEGHRPTGTQPRGAKHVRRKSRA